MLVRAVRLVSPGLAKRSLLAIACTLLIFSSFGNFAVTSAEETGGAPTGEAKVRPEVAELVGQLDSERFAVRRHAAQRLDALVRRADHGPLLAQEFRQLLGGPNVSYEVRWRLERWLESLPDVSPAADAAPEELARWIDQLDDDSFAVRTGAADRLDWLEENPKLACRILQLLKERLADEKTPAESRRYLVQAYESARADWLLSDPAGWELPPVTDEQIRGWIRDLVRPVPDSVRRPWLVHDVAHRELLDALARDERVPAIREALEAAMKEDLGERAAARLQALVELTRPALVAEYWQEKRHMGEQHLLVGVPSLSEGANQPSHFDRIDDTTAHCASGATLSPGDYPVGVAFPHPIQDVAFFRIVNLPTPRRRMAYGYEVKLDDKKRLAAISHQTLDRFLEQRKPLGESELTMLALLDPVEVSRFAGKYFHLLDDEALPPSGRYRAGGRPSRFGVMCVQLAASGTREAIPGLLSAIEAHRIQPPGPTAPYALDWLAALAIAQRDPWPEVDAWLGSLLQREDSLVIDKEESAELGATAAGILLERHEQRPSDFGLQRVRDSLLDEYDLKGLHFLSPEARQRAIDWWRTHHSTEGHGA